MTASLIVHPPGALKARICQPIAQKVDRKTNLLRYLPGIRVESIDTIQEKPVSRQQLHQATACPASSIRQAGSKAVPFLVSVKVSSAASLSAAIVAGSRISSLSDIPPAL